MHELVNQKIASEYQSPTILKSCQLQIYVMPFEYGTKELEIGFEVCLLDKGNGPTTVQKNWPQYRP
jgi:hypothetical protein